MARKYYSIVNIVVTLVILVILGVVGAMAWKKWKEKQESYLTVSGLQFNNPISACRGPNPAGSSDGGCFVPGHVIF